MKKTRKKYNGMDLAQYIDFKLYKLIANDLHPKIIFVNQDQLRELGETFSTEFIISEVTDEYIDMRYKGYPVIVKNAVDEPIVGI